MMRRVGQVASLEEMRHAYKILAGKPEEERPRETGWEDVD
jgi:hypothetical protein